MEVWITESPCSSSDFILLSELVIRPCTECKFFYQHNFNISWITSKDFRVQKCTSTRSCNNTFITIVVHYSVPERTGCWHTPQHNQWMDVSPGNFPSTCIILYHNIYFLTHCIWRKYLSYLREWYSCTKVTYLNTVAINNSVKKILKQNRMYYSVFLCLLLLPEHLLH